MILNKKSLWQCIVIVFVVLVCIGSLYFGFNTLFNLDEFKIKKREISLAIPDWISEKGKQEIRNISLLNREYRIYDKHLTEKIASIYEQHPLFKSVDSVTREFPNRINIRLELRRPIAAIKCKANYFLIDSDAVRLPPEYYIWPTKNDHAVYILTNKLYAIPPCGKRWNDKAILAGIELVRFLKNNKADKILEIEEIDVSMVASRSAATGGDIILRTKSGTKIKWGSSSLYAGLNEPSDAEKLRNLFSVAKVEGTKLNGLEYIDVRWDRPVGKR